MNNYSTGNHPVSSGLDDIDSLANTMRDIKEPLGVITGLVELALCESGQPAVRDTLRLAARSSRDLIRVVDSFLDYSLLSQGRLALFSDTVQSRDVVDDVLEAVAPMIMERRLKLELKCDRSQLVPVRLDRFRTVQALAGMLEDAIERAPEGGALTFRVQCDADREAGRARFVFSASIPGAAPNPAARYPRRPAYELRQAVLRRLVELISGSVEAANGNGIYVVRLDFEIADDVVAVVFRENGSREALAGKRVLLCDGDAIGADIVSRLLRLAGCTVDVAADGKKALDMFASSEARHYGAVLVALRADSDEPLCAAGIRSLDRPDVQRLPIIALLSAADGETALRARQAGMNATLVAPVEPERLYDTLAKLIS